MKHHLGAGGLPSGTSDLLEGFGEGYVPVPPSVTECQHKCHVCYIWSPCSTRSSVMMIFCCLVCGWFMQRRGRPRPPWLHVVCKGRGVVESLVDLSSYSHPCSEHPFGCINTSCHSGMKPLVVFLCQCFSIVTRTKLSRPRGELESSSCCRLQAVVDRAT